MWWIQRIRWIQRIWGPWDSGGFRGPFGGISGSILLLCGSILSVTYIFTNALPAWLTCGGALLGVNIGYILVLSASSSQKRGGHALGHLYIGVGLPAALRVVLCGVEYLSGLFRAVSLTLRILCNTVAGHSLLLVLQGLLWWSAMYLHTLYIPLRVYAWYARRVLLVIACMHCPRVLHRAALHANV